MKFLLDSNIFIPLEPASPADIEEGTAPASELVRLIAASEHQYFIHPASAKDIRKDRDSDRREMRQILFQKYPQLPCPPEITPQIESTIGKVHPDTNDWVDHQLLAAIVQNAVDFLVTEDQGIHKKAIKLGVGDRVVTIPAAISILQGLFDKVPSELPAVLATKAHQLNESDPIFESLRKDYEGEKFDAWLKKCKLEHRDAWVVKGVRSDYAAIMIVNHEKEFTYRDLGMNGKILKVCTFKVSEKYPEHKYGELLLKTAFDYYAKNKYDWLFLEVHPKHEHLLGYLEDFGFENAGQKGHTGEYVLSKPMLARQKDRETMEPLAFHIRYGPFEAKICDKPCFAIPIQPVYHGMLFPELEEQTALFAGKTPFGNSIRKAYLCHSNIR